MVSSLDLYKEEMALNKLKRDLPELKSQLKLALADEKEAKPFYSGIVNLATRIAQDGRGIRPSSIINASENVARKMKSILEQEIRHADMIHELISELEKTESTLPKVESDLKKRQEEVKKREDEEARRRRR